MYETCGTQAPSVAQETLRDIVIETASLLREGCCEARLLADVLDGGSDKLEKGSDPKPLTLRDHLVGLRSLAREVARLNTVNHSVVGRAQPPSLMTASDSIGLQAQKSRY